MRKSILAVATTAALAAPGLAAAQTPAPAPSPLTGNMTIATDYRFRGISQTFQRPAFQGGIDFAHSSGLYIGNWNSNVSSTLYPNANLEMDFYGGYKKSFGDLGIDVGAIYYYYPGSSLSVTGPEGGECNDCRIDNTEVYFGASWKWISAKFYYAVSDFFAIPDTKGSTYLDLSATYDAGGGWGIVGHIGHQEVRHLSDADYTDWKLGVTKDIGGWVLGAAYVDTNAKDAFYELSDARKTMNLGKAGLVLSVSKTF